MTNSNCELALAETNFKASFHWLLRFPASCLSIFRLRCDREPFVVPALAGSGASPPPEDRASIPRMERRHSCRLRRMFIPGRIVGLSLLCLLLTEFISQGAETFQERLTPLQAALSVDPTNATLLLKLADLCHDEGVKDNAPAVLLAEKYLNQVLAQNPSNALALVMLGSTYTMKGRDAPWPLAKINLVKEGNAKMDAGVALAPEDVQVRFFRANNNYYMPAFLERKEIVQKDFAWLWDKIQAHPDPYDANLKQTVALRQGQLLMKNKQAANALGVWKKGIAFAPETDLASEMRGLVVERSR